ncbi:MAG: glycosyltransferase family 4 protein [Candidatus Helarchaeota archaeon]
MKITWLSAEMGDYTSGGANHNRLYIEYLKNNLDVEKISIVRWPMPEKGLILPEKQVFNGIEIYSPIIQSDMKNALNSLKSAKLNFSDKIKFALLRFLMKVKGYSRFDSIKVKKPGLLGSFALLILSLETPFPNPFLKTIAEYVKKTKPDIIQSQVEHLSVAGALAREDAKAHFSFQYLIEGSGADTKEGSLEYELANRLSEALDWLIDSENVDYFFPVSESVKKYLINHKAQANSIKIINSPIKMSSFPITDKNNAREKLGLPKNRKIILSIGRMMPRKRFEDLLKILKRFSDDVILYIKRSSCISDDIIDTSKKMYNQIKKLKLGDRVIINESELSYNQMIYVYSACDVAVYPFLEEPFGMCAIEAMASARPIIVYNSGYLPYFVNKNGFIVEPLDVDSLYEKTKILLDDEKLSQQMGEKGREMAVKYDINILGEKLINIYKEYL